MSGLLGGGSRENDSCTLSAASEPRMEDWFGNGSGAFRIEVGSIDGMAPTILMDEHVCYDVDKIVDDLDLR